METITIKDILYILAAITAIVTFAKMLTKPYKELQDNFEDQKKSIADLSNTIKAQQKLLNSSLKVEMLLMEHIVYGNHIDTLKKELTNLQSTIVDVNS